MEAKNKSLFRVFKLFDFRVFSLILGGFHGKKVFFLIFKILDFRVFFTKEGGLHVNISIL